MDPKKLFIDPAIRLILWEMEHKVKAENHFYDGLFYRRFIDPALANIRKRVADLVPKGSRVIDIGCGTGDQILFLADRIEAGVCVELSERMHGVAKDRAREAGMSNCEFLLADAADLSGFEDSNFDVAMSSMVIHEMPEEKRIPVLAEMKRLGKKIILVDWVCPQDQRLKAIGTHIIEFMAGWQHYSGYRSFMRNGGIPVLLSQLDLKVIETQTTSKGTIQLWLCGEKPGNNSQALT